jgi:integrase
LSSRLVVRTVKALETRIKDIDLEVKPTSVHIRSKFYKTKKARVVFISDEATEALRDWIILNIRAEFKILKIWSFVNSVHRRIVIPGAYILI